MLILTTLMFEHNFAAVVFEWGYLQGQTHAHIWVLTGSGLLVTCWHSVQPIMLYNAHFMYTRLWPYSSKYPSDFVPRAFMFSENNKSSLLWHYSFNFKVWWVNVVVFSLLRHNELVRRSSNYFCSRLTQPWYNKQQIGVQSTNPGHTQAQTPPPKVGDDFDLPSHSPRGAILTLWQLFHSAAHGAVPPALRSSSHVNVGISYSATFPTQLSRGPGCSEAFKI